VLRLATTTSTADSGLLDAILPDFEEQFNARVDVVAVGTGQAIELGQNGDADVILVHARAREDAFVADGYGLARYDVMYNDFILVGPPEDPAGVRAATTAAEAFAAIADAQAPFASRGDDSGTHTKELAVWQAAGIEPDPAGGWYQSLGQGMGETLTFANESGSYTLADRGTYLFQRDNLPHLVILFGGNSIAENPDRVLYNPYGVLPVNPDLHEGIQADLAQDFADWLTSVETQEMIGDYGVEQFGQPLFYPDSEAYREANP
jgi:tungstate transport system substrate-binding protein